MSSPTAAPSMTTTTTNPAIRSALRRLLEAISSYTDAVSELDVRDVAGGLVGLEVLARTESHPAGDHVRRDLLDRLVVGQNGVVVELAGVGDPALRGGQLFLELEEVL